jgi:hypothetical protein
MSNNKMCPLLTITTGGRDVGCYGEGCAFWNSPMQTCAIQALSQAAAYFMINDSRDRMPRHEREMLHHSLKEKP